MFNSHKKKEMIVVADICMCRKHSFSLQNSVRLLKANFRGIVARFKLLVVCRHVPSTVYSLVHS